MDDKLLTREEFKKQVFARTNGKCCVPGCTCDAVDAHHILDRHLWNHGGYILSNGAVSFGFNRDVAFFFLAYV